MKKFHPLLLVFTVLVLTAIACQSTSTESPPEGILFRDDFEDTSSGWDQVNVDEGITDYEDGHYRMFVNTANTDAWANPGLDFQDVIVEVEATKVGGPDDNDLGVLCRYQDVNNFYFFIISSDGFYALGRVINGEQELLGMESMLTSDVIRQGNATNTIVGECVGETLTLKVNGEELAIASDSEFIRGDVGLIAGTFSTAGTDIHFDNFVVREP